MGRKQSSSSPLQAGQDQTLTIEEAIQRARAHWNAGQAPQTEMLCQRVLAAWPGQADALHLLGVMAHAFSNLDLGIQHLRQACLAPRAPAVYFSDLAASPRHRSAPRPTACRSVLSMTASYAMATKVTPASLGHSGSSDGKTTAMLAISFQSNSKIIS